MMPLLRALYWAFIFITRLHFLPGEYVADNLPWVPAGFCPRWAAPGGSARHSTLPPVGSAWHLTLPPGTYAEADPSARHSKSIKYVIRKLPVIFFYLNNIIDHYLVKCNTTICTQLPTSDSVKYDVHSKPERIV